MARTCDLTLTDRVRSQNAPFLLSRCMRNRDHGEQAWRFVARNWTALNERFPSTSIIRMVEGIRMLMRPQQASEVSAFFSERGVPQAAKTLQQLIERQQINTTFRERESGPLSASLR
jgi:puromycin-sensitive aminopeptidase